MRGGAGGGGGDHWYLGGVMRKKESLDLDFQRLASVDYVLQEVQTLSLL